MLTSIQSLKDFGIFDDYSRPAGMNNFSDRNVIYGWNYSGKTTLSRLFHTINQKVPHPDFTEGKFSITDSSGATINHENFNSCTKTIRVFNSDFVSESLNWNGGAFRPILLLGAEAIDAKKKIEHYEKVIKRCTTSSTLHRQKIQSLEERVTQGKTATAKTIKTTLDIVEAFTAVHLNQLLTTLALDEKSYLLSQDQLNKDLSLASSSEKDKLPLFQNVEFSSSAGIVHARTELILKRIPASSQIIPRLKDNSILADWVREGLKHHSDTDKCEFCLNKITSERRSDLDAHFSKELTEQREALEDLKVEISELNFKGVNIRESDLNTQFRPKLKPIMDILQKVATNYNQWVESLQCAINNKLENQFSEVSLPISPQPLICSLENVLKNLNALIDESNGISRNFVKEKKAAVQRLKLHYAEQFCIDYDIANHEIKKSEEEKKAQSYENAKAQAHLKLSEQQALINRAQNGREKINERIVSLLNSESIQIEVVNNSGVDSFILKRNGRIAKHLSEGEKTSIALAFFLTKLLEDPNLDDVIVYIDDPISSLDSNHIFQVYSILKTTFFKKLPTEKIPVTTCKQLFISTHNFEFFSLLRDLPGEISYYLAKRVSPTKSTFINLPTSISRYSSEYHYLFHILNEFDESADKTNIEHLMALPNAARRFLELYTYAKLPVGRKVPVEKRAERLFGAEKTSRILKVLHHFSHLESIERLIANTDLVSDIEGAVSTLMQCLKEDKVHYEALKEAIN